MEELQKRKNAGHVTKRKEKYQINFVLFVVFYFIKY